MPESVPPPVHFPLRVREERDRRLASNEPPTAPDRRAGAPHRCACSAEPGLDDLLGDPVMRLLMRRDGIEEGGLRRLLVEVGRRRGAGGAPS